MLKSAFKTLLLVLAIIAFETIESKSIAAELDQKQTVSHKLSVSGQEASIDGSNEAADGNKELEGGNHSSDLRPTPFKVGEKLTFSIEFGSLKAGTAVFSVLGIDDIAGLPCYHLQITIQNTKAFGFIYKIGDQYDSWIDVYELLSRQFEKKINAGKTNRHQIITLDQDKHLSLRDNGKKVKTVPIVPEAQDDISIFYHFRGLDFEVGEVIYLDNYDRPEDNPIEIRVLRRETIKVPAGKFDCYVIQPIFTSGGLVNYKGKMKLYITADEKKIPVMIEILVTFGTVKAYLTDYLLSNEPTTASGVLVDVEG